MHDTLGKIKCCIMLVLAIQLLLLIALLVDIRARQIKTTGMVNNINTACLQ